MNGKTTKKSAAKTSEQQTKGTSGKKQNNLTSKKKEKVHWYQKTGWILFLLFMFFPVGIVLTWRNKKWNKIVKTLFSGLFGFWFLILCVAAATPTPEKPLEEIILSLDSDQVYDINNPVDIVVETNPEDYHIPKSAFEITGGELDFKDDKITFTSSVDGEFDISVEYSDVMSNTLTLKFEDKEAIAQAQIAAEQAEQERIAAEQAEQERIAAEQAEQARIAAEQAEQERIAAEQARIAAEQAEQERVAAEQARIAQEQAQIAAEQARIAQEQNQQTAPVEAMVWLSATGSKYHNKPNCGNMNPNNARQVTLSEAQMNYGPCKNCYR
ncbi:hypothetical protein [Schaedlerella arabinosiphila]|uniref:hypothetical protein n=2 Tax=Schaedlerella arabinosiphila TaxID=2044587 RepID=UPI00255802B1|nr:hypothetical protein [Schaedlerella arabinosiphila]